MMNNSKNRIQNSESKRHLYVFMAAIVLAVLLMYGFGGVVSNMVEDNTHITASATRKVDVLNHVHYRFRRIYNGADMSARKANGSATYKGPQMTRSAQQSTAAPHVAASNYSSASGTSVVVPMGNSASGLSTLSSQTQHSYGGGAMFSPVSVSAKSIHTESSATYSNTSIVMPSSRLIAVNKTPVTTVDASAQSAEDMLRVDRGGNIGDPGTVVEPIGEGWIMLIFVLAYALYFIFKKNHALSKRSADK